MATQVARIDDRVFAQGFADHMELPGHAPSDFNHRLVHFDGHRLLAGIRFYATRSDQPFVDVIAHDFDELEPLLRCVAAEWIGFAPLAVRLLFTPQVPLPAGAQIDMSILGARYQDLNGPDGRVHLATFDTPEEAISLIEERFSALESEDPLLSRRVFPAVAEDVRAWHDAGTMRAICPVGEGRHCDDRDEVGCAGLLAVQSDLIEWLEGDVVQEEIVSAAYAGHGYAASAQRAWADQTGAKLSDLLLGTIDHLNVASRLSAMRAGRSALLNYVFLPLPGVERLPG